MSNLRTPLAGLVVAAVVACCPISPAGARAADPWELVSSIGVARASAAVATVDGKVYVIGGRANGVLKTTAVENSVEVYDPAANSWTALAPKPTGVVNDEAGVIGGIVYVPGGGVLEAYNPATNTWATRAPMPAVVSSGAVAVVGNKLYVLGGTVEGVVGGTCYVYDQPGNTWSTCVSMTHSRRSAGAGVIDGKIYVYGGDSGSFFDASRDLERYDPSNNTWTTLANSGGVGWTGVGVVGYGGLLYACGGAYRSYSPSPPAFVDTRSNACNTYDPGTDTWALYGTMLWARANHGLVEAGGRLYAIGGDSHNYMVHTTSERSPVLPGSPVLVEDSFRSVAQNDGWVLEQDETSGKGGTLDAAATTARVGDDASDRQYRAILHFDTAGLPDDAVITGVTLRIKRQSITGTTPFTTHEFLIVDVKAGAYRENPALEKLDFHAVGSRGNAGRFIKTPAEGWYRAPLRPVSYPFINLTGTTQFRLRFEIDDDDDLGADYLSFYSGNGAEADRPELIVTYYVP